MKMSFYSHANKTYFHDKGFAPSLVLEVRVFGTRNWPIPPARQANFNSVRRRILWSDWLNVNERLRSMGRILPTLYCLLCPARKDLVLAI